MEDFIKRLWGLLGDDFRVLEVGSDHSGRPHRSSSIDFTRASRVLDLNGWGAGRYEHDRLCAEITGIFRVVLPDYRPYLLIESVDALDLSKVRYLLWSKDGSWYVDLI